MHDPYLNKWKNIFSTGCSLLVEAFLPSHCWALPFFCAVSPILKILSKCCFSPHLPGFSLCLEFLLNAMLSGVAPGCLPLTIVIIGEEGMGAEGMEGKRIKTIHFRKPTQKDHPGNKTRWCGWHFYFAAGCSYSKSGADQSKHVPALLVYV